MNKRIRGKVFALLVIAAISALPIVAQKAAVAPKPIIFAALHDGGTLEPVAYVNKGQLEAPANGSDEPAILAAFNKSYFKTGTAYRLIFGGANAGTATVKSADPKSDCGKNMATITTKGLKTPLKGLVMALATNAPIKSTSSFRRKPTAAEKEEIDGLVRAEYLKQKLTPKVLRFHNLTALDVDNDGTPEFVGSYWVEVDRSTRGLLFFITGKGANGKYSIGYSEYRKVEQSDVMSGEIKDVDEGVYNEMLLDVYDHDADGTSEVFTYVQSFEGAGFNVYRRDGTKWTRSFEGANYHCGY